MRKGERPTVSVVIPNLDGKEHLEACLDSLRALDYPSELIEVIVVDNGSTDGSLGMVASKHPGVKVIELGRNFGFATPCNRGAKQAAGEMVAFLNNDMRVDARWLEALVAPIASGEADCTASKVLSWDGQTVDFVGALMNFEGKGAQLDYGQPYDPKKHDRPAETLFANGGSMLIRRDVFEKVGGFDEDYFAYYEDVDLGWRLWLMGYRVMYAPESVAYHHHHGTSGRFSKPKLRVLYERNSLVTAMKNYSDESLGRLFAPALMLSVARFFTDSRIDASSYDMSDPSTDPPTSGASPEAVASLVAMKQVLDSLPQIMTKREQIQRDRRRSDLEIFRYFGEPHLAAVADPAYQELQVEVQRMFGVYEAFAARLRPRVVFLTNEVIGKKMAGPGIRCVELARILSEDCDVTVLGVNEPDLGPEPFRALRANNDVLKELARQSDVIVCQGIALISYQWLTRENVPLVIDLYDPFPLAILEQFRGEKIERRWTENHGAREAMHYQLNEGDFFMCASEHQRGLWMGVLESVGRINPSTYDDDPTLRTLLDVVPFGIPAAPPHKTRPALRGVNPAIGEDDFLMLWAGGIYNWFDPISLIEAVGKVADSHPRVKLAFLGTQHPNPAVPEMEVAVRARKLAQDLGLYDKHVFFGEGWVPYEERANYLLEADVGVSLHLRTVETDFSFRTRILDYFWAGLPILTTEGDSMAQLTERRSLGLTVPDGDPDAVAAAIVQMMDNPDQLSVYRSNVSEIAKEYTWDRIVDPLRRFCHSPRAAPDADDRNGPQAERGLVKRLRHHYEHGGITQIAKTAAKVARLKMQRR